MFNGPDLHSKTHKFSWQSANWPEFPDVKNLKYELKIFLH